MENELVFFVSFKSISRKLMYRFCQYAFFSPLRIINFAIMCHKVAKLSSLRIHKSVEMTFDKDT